MAKGRATSPKPRKGSEAGAKDVNNVVSKKSSGGMSTASSVRARPEGLRQRVIILHALLVGAIATFAGLGQAMMHPIPEGKFEKKDGSLIDMEDYDPVEMGPYPKCHPHNGEHRSVAANGSHIWVKNDAVVSTGPFPVGHPDNPEWVKRSSELALQDLTENRFTWVGLQPNLHLLAMAVLCVYLGSLHGVWLYTEQPESREAVQVMQKEDAYWFPVMGSCVLFGLFVVLKYLGSEYIKLLITGGIVFMCIFGVGGNVDQFTAVVRNKVSVPLMTIPYFDQSVSLVELMGMVLAAAMAAGYMFTKNWVINNLFGISFSLVGIKMIGLSSYKVGAIMLVGLFFYDVFWVFGSKSVFGSNVMVSVAKGVEAPIKLMFPRMMGGCGVLLHSMLGLGDIVVPGIFIAFLAKFDSHNIGKGKSDTFVYLNSVMVAYFLSLVTTVCIMLFFNAAQPALLYIVPYVLVASLGCGVARGETKELWNFEIAEDEQEALTEAEDEKKGN